MKWYVGIATALIVGVSLFIGAPAKAASPQFKALDIVRCDSITVLGSTQQAVQYCTQQVMSNRDGCVYWAVVDRTTVPWSGKVTHKDATLQSDGSILENCGPIILPLTPTKRK